MLHYLVSLPTVSLERLPSVCRFHEKPSQIADSSQLSVSLLVLLDRESQLLACHATYCILDIADLYSVIQVAAHDYATLTAGRCIAGVGTGILSSTAPMYISEVAPPNIRGALLVLEQFAIVLGIVVMYFIVRTHLCL